MRYIQTLIGTCCLLISAGAAAEEAIKTFKAGERVKAAEINANFQAIMDEVEAARAEIADAVSFEGLEDVYDGLEEEAEEATSALESSAAAVVACSAEDTSCVIVGNKASVTCSAGETGKLKSVLSSPYANAAFLLVEIEGNCIEDNLLVTRGAAFYTKPGASTKASITAVTDRALTCVQNYCFFQNIDINGSFLTVRGSTVVLEKDITVTDTTPAYSATAIASEGGLLILGSNVTIDGSMFVEHSNVQTKFFASSSSEIGNTVTGKIMLRGGNLLVKHDLTAPQIEAQFGSTVELKYGNFDIDSIVGEVGSVINLVMGSDGSLATEGISLRRGSHLNGFFNNSSNTNAFEMTAADDGSFPGPGVLYLDTLSSAMLYLNSTAKIRKIYLEGASAISVTQADVEVDELLLFSGSQARSNGGGSDQIIVKEAMTLKSNVVVEAGLIDLRATGNDISDYCNAVDADPNLCSEP